MRETKRETVKERPEPPPARARRPRRRDRTKSKKETRAESKPASKPASKPEAKGQGQLRALVTCAHPKQAVLLAIVMGVGALLSDRPAREAGVAAAAVLLTQLILGLGNDVADREQDSRSGAENKPLAHNLVPLGNATYVIAALTLLAIPVSVQSGTVAGIALLATLVVGYVHNKFLHRGWLSWVGWSLTGALFPAFLSYGGWGGGEHGNPPTIAITGAAAALGFCLHFVTALPDLVADNQAGVRHLPLRVALKTGAPRLLAITTVLSILATAGLVLSALEVGLRQ